MGSALLAALQKSAVLGAPGDATADSSSNTNAVGALPAQVQSSPRELRQQDRAAGGTVAQTYSMDGAGTSSSYSYGPGGLQDRTEVGSVSSSSSGPTGSSNSSKQMKPPQAAVQGTVQPKGIYLEGIPPETTRRELEAIFAAYGQVMGVVIIEIKWRATKCAFVDFATEAAAQQVCAVVFPFNWGVPGVSFDVEVVP